MRYNACSNPFWFTKSKYSPPESDAISEAVFSHSRLRLWEASLDLAPLLFGGNPVARVEGPAEVSPSWIGSDDPERATAAMPQPHLAGSKAASAESRGAGLEVSRVDGEQWSLPVLYGAQK
jgi:hypothetical protein